MLAIVITILVFDLRPPQSEPGRLLEGLLAQWPTYVAYVASYLYVAVVWLNHKVAFRRIRGIDRGLHWANLGILFTTALLPFPTEVLSGAVQRDNASDARVATSLYALVGVLLCASWLAFFHYLSRHPELVEDDVGERFFHGERPRAWIGIALYAAAGGLGYLVAPPVALAIFVALPILYAFTERGLPVAPRRDATGLPWGSLLVWECLRRDRLERGRRFGGSSVPGCCCSS